MSISLARERVLVAKLTAKEAELLKSLQAKVEAPDEPSVGRNINVSFDLGDEKQVAMAKKFGFLPSDDDDDDGDDDGDDDADDAPKRRGYFG